MTDVVLTVTAPGVTAVDCRTWADQLAMIERELVQEGREVDETACLEWANELLATVSENAGAVERTYTASDLTLADGRITLPASMIGPPASVRWDGLPIRPMSVEDLDREQPGWQDQTASAPCGYVASGRMLRLAPPVADIAPLEIDARAYLLSRFPASEPGDVNPLIYFPESCQYLPAYYVLANLPYDPGKSAEAARFQRNAARVADMLPRVAEVISALTSKQFWLEG